MSWYELLVRQYEVTVEALVVDSEAVMLPGDYLHTVFALAKKDKEISAQRIEPKVRSDKTAESIERVMHINELAADEDLGVRIDIEH